MRLRQMRDIGIRDCRDNTSHVPQGGNRDFSKDNFAKAIQKGKSDGKTTPELQ